MGLEKRVRKIEDKLKKGLRNKTLISAVFGLIVSGCGVNFPGPGGRLGCVPIPSPITVYLGENAARSQRGIAYTCKAGHIDVSHVRKYAEWTKHFKENISENLKRGKPYFSFKGSEPGGYDIKINFPENWNNFPIEKKEEIIEEVSIELGEYLAYTMSVWHETLTWFGWTYTGFIPEFNSSFSWEDRFSDSFGCYLGAKALKQRAPFNETFNLLLESEFERLGIQPKNNSKKATKNVEGKWYAGKGFSGGMLVRNFDIGLGDKEVNPSIPQIEDCQGIKPWACPVPNLGSVRKYKFSVNIGINPGCKEGREVMRIVGRQGRIDPEEDFPKIIECIIKDAETKGYKVSY